MSLLVITWGSLRAAVGSKAMTKRAEVKSMPQLTEAGDETFELLTNMKNNWSPLIIEFPYENVIIQIIIMVFLYGDRSQILNYLVDLGLNGL